MTKTIVYIGNFKSNIMDAQCQLVLGNAYIFRELGYNVVFIGNDKTGVLENPLLSKTTIDGFSFYNIEFNRNIKGILQIHKKWHDIKNILDLYSEISIIILYGSPGLAIQLFQLVKWCKNNHVKLLSNCADISSQAHGTIFERVAKKADRILKDYINYNYTDGIIAVSSYLKKHFEIKYNNPVIILPPLKDTNNLSVNCNYKSNNIINLVYIGIPFPIDGRVVDEEAYKDRLDLFIDLLISIPHFRDIAKFDIYGLTKEQYTNVVKRHKRILKEFGGSIEFHGSVSYEESLKIFMNADFSVLYRSRSVMTMAGFSSKLVESISCGTPVILTNTSDYSKYLTNEKHSCFISNNFDEARNQLMNILILSRDKIEYMKKECRKEKIFDYRNFVDKVDDFLSNILKE